LSPASLGRPLRAASSDCSSCAITFRAATSGLRLSPPAASAPFARSLVGSVRRYATTLATCGADSSGEAGMALPAIPCCTTCASWASLRSTCQAIVPISGGSLVSDRASVPSPVPATP
jgi:hypothetical protein